MKNSPLFINFILLETNAILRTTKRNAKLTLKTIRIAPFMLH
jgi:hypothetical protein